MDATIYLAGAIDNLRDDDASPWWERARKLIILAHLNVYYPRAATGSPAEIYERNQAALRTARCVVAEL